MKAMMRLRGHAAELLECMNKDKTLWAYYEEDKEKIMMNERRRRRRSRRSRGGEVEERGREKWSGKRESLRRKAKERIPSSQQAKLQSFRKEKPARMIKKNTKKHKVILLQR